MDKRNFLKILQSVDAFFPVGAFTLSNGLEDYVLRERIGSEEDLGEYLNSFLQTFPYQDLGIMSLAYRNAGNREYLSVLDAVAAAVKGAKEIRLGSIRMCSRYVKAREAMGDCTGELRWYKEQIKRKSCWASCRQLSVFMRLNSVSPRRKRLRCTDTAACRQS